VDKREGRASIWTWVRGLSHRTIGGVVIAVVVVLFIVLNRDETKISFVLFEWQTSLWVALTSLPQAASSPDSSSAVTATAPSEAR